MLTTTHSTFPSAWRHPRRKTWAVWRWVREAGVTKPKTAYANLSYDSALATVDAGAGEGLSCRFDPTSDGVARVHLENCLSPDGDIEPWACEVAERFPGAYIEPACIRWHLLSGHQILTGTAVQEAEMLRDDSEGFHHLWQRFVSPSDAWQTVDEQRLSPDTDILHRVRARCTWNPQGRPEPEKFSRLSHDW